MCVHCEKIAAREVRGEGAAVTPRVTRAERPTLDELRAQVPKKVVRRVQGRRRA